MRNIFSNGIIILFAAIWGLTTACSKERQPGHPTPPLPYPAMEYFNLNEKEIRGIGAVYPIDVNHDGRKDLEFTTGLVGDPVYKVDKLQFLVSSNESVNLPVSAEEEVPVLAAGDLIMPEDFSEYHWFELSSIILVQKIISFTEPVMWQGNWKNSVHRYLPYQVIENGGRYNGWVELSVDIAGEKIILHRAAISKEANRIVAAGK